MNDINSNQQLKPYLRDYPFTPKNIELAILCYDSNKKNIYHPYISVVSVDEGIVTYRTGDKDKPFEYKTEVRETYEESLEILGKKIN